MALAPEAAASMAPVTNDAFSAAVDTLANTLRTSGALEGQPAMRAALATLEDAQAFGVASFNPPGDPVQVIIASHGGDVIAAARGLGYIIRRDARGFYPAQDLETASRHGFHDTREAAARIVVESAFL